MNKILIVDDSTFMRTLIKDFLSDHSPPLELHEADSRSSAAAVLEKIRPDLVLLDVVMKDNEFEGVEVLKHINQSNINTKVIMLTSVGQIAVVDECKKLGAVSYIEKPFEREVILKTIDKYLTEA